MDGLPENRRLVVIIEVGCDVIRVNVSFEPKEIETSGSKPAGSSVDDAPSLGWELK